jgi:hypothetical protein
MNRRTPSMTERLGRRRLLAGAGAARLVAAVDGCSVGALSKRRDDLT